MKKSLTLLTAIFLLSSCSISINVNESTENKKEVNISVEETKTPIDALKEIEGVDFSTPEKHSFEWKTGYDTEPILVNGQKISAHTLLEDSQKIDSYFFENSFKIDEYNLADGTTASLAGFKKEDFVCTVLVNGEYEEFTMPKEGTMAKIDVSCGELK